MIGRQPSQTRCWKGFKLTLLTSRLYLVGHFNSINKWIDYLGWAYKCHTDQPEQTQPIPLLGWNTASPRNRAIHVNEIHISKETAWTRNTRKFQLSSITIFFHFFEDNYTILLTMLTCNLETKLHTWEDGLHVVDGDGECKQWGELIDKLLHICTTCK